MIEHQVQLDGALGALELGPVIHRQAQVDDGRVDAHELVLEAELALAGGLGRDLGVKAVEDLFEQLPGTVRVGVRQRRARRGSDAQMRQLALAALEPPSISRSECARPNWQNSIATSWAQLEKPLLAYSAPVRLTICSNSSRGISLRI